MKILIITIVVIAVAILLEIRRELSFFKKVNYDVKIKGLDKNKKVIFLSDLHNHVYGEGNEMLLESIRDENPDYILIGGDMLVGKDGISYQKALDFVKKLPEICKVYYANGNHEQRMKEMPENYDASFEQYKKELEVSGVEFLENRSVDLQWGNKKVRVTGLEIPLRCYTHIHKEVMFQEEITERVGEKQKGSYEILLAHNPSYMKMYLERKSDLILSGHLHGGIVRIPGLVGAISPSFELFPKYSGDHYKEKDTDIVVSKGLGTHTFNIRLFNPAEMVILNFKDESLV